MASTNTNTKTPNPNNPSALPSRYEIRTLGREHASWVAAIVMHSNIFYSPVWPVIYPEKKTERLFAGMDAADYLVNHQIDSGHSFGVFDTQYEYKRPESAAVGGKLYWDRTEPSIQESQGSAAEAKRLEDQMDFPLVSVAMSYDGFDPLELPKMESIMAVLPHFGLLYHILADKDTRDPNDWQPKAKNQVLFRNATATRSDYFGAKLMAELARWLCREADQRGFRGVQIETVHDAVFYVWSNARDGYKSIVVSTFDTATWRDENGVVAYEPAKVVIGKVYVDLKPKA